MNHYNKIDKNKEYLKAYRERTKQNINEYAKAYRQTPEYKEKMKLYMRKRRKNNKMKNGY